MLPSVLAPLLALALSASAIPFSEESSEGLVVLGAPAPPSEASAGLLPGDVLVSWRRGGEAGLLRWPSGLLEVETEQAPRGAVELVGRRAGEPMRWRMPPVRWNVRTRPALSPHLRALYREGAQRFANQDPAGGAAAWRAAVEAAARAEDRPRMAWFLGELGRTGAESGRWREADAAYEEAVRKAEDTGMATFLLRNWCATYVQRENWERAETCYRRVLAKAQPGTFAAARDLAVLAGLATRRGDLEAAERMYREALSIRSGIVVLGPYLVQAIRDEVAGFGAPGPSGVTREEIEDLRRKLQRLRETLLAEAGLKPPGDRPAKTAAAPAKKEKEKEEPSPLEALQRALAKAEREEPGSLTVADRWQDLGELSFEDGDLIAAEIAWLRALDVREKLAPGTLREARTLHDLGRVHAQAGRDRAAASFLCRAARALDRRNRPAPEDAEAQATFGEETAAYDRDCIAALVAARRPDAAFLALERSRVRGAALSSALDRRRKEVEQERAQALTRLSRLSTSRDRDEVDLLAAYAEELESRRDEIVHPLKLDSLRAALAPGTLLLAWSIGEDQSFLFAVRPSGAPGPGVEVFPVLVKAADLLKRIPVFAAQAASVETEPGRPRTEARELYRLLLGPAEAPIAAAERLILLPDEVLAPLPFGALIQGEKRLEERARVETAASATAWAAKALTPDASSPL